MTRNSKTIFALAGGVAAAASVAKAVLRRSRKVSVRGKTVFITGGSRGLGLVLAREFAERGARVAVCARDEKELQRVRAEFAGAGQPLVAPVCDVSLRAEARAVVHKIRDQLGEIDILVNNAGTILVGPAENQDTEAFEDAMRTNFWGPFNIISEILPAMMERRRGRIVNIASIGGKIPFPHLLPYSTSKFALVGYSEGLRAELAKHNVFVTTVCPGLMRTGSPRNAVFTGQAEKEYAWFTISDSLPVVSIGARRAARQIIDATVHGDPEIHLGLAAKLGSVVQGCAPGATAEILSLVDRLLPDALPGHASAKKGSESESAATENISTFLTREAEIADNQT